MSNDIAIKVDSVSKSFKLPHEKNSSIKSALINFRKKKRGYEMQHVLKDISFEIKKGEFFGIVGRNGSGKSTLLKLISQIYTPDKGSITVNGKLTPFIELGVGFNPELSGRDNVYLNGALLGFSRAEMDEMYDEIVAFAELERFMDQKLKNYSSGMQVRLAFSIAIRTNTDILVLDEVLAVGDEAFQRKCNEYFASVKNEGKTIILVTHGMDAVRKYCDRAMMVRKGEIVTIGSPEDVANEYSLENLNPLVNDKGEEEQKESAIKGFKVELLNSEQVNQDDEVIVKYTVSSDKDIEAAIVMDLYNMDENYYLYCFGAPQKQLKPGKPTTFEVVFDISPFNNMNVIVHSSVRDKDGNLLTFSNDANSPHFMIRRNDYTDNKKPQAGVIFKNGRNARWQ